MSQMARPVRASTTPARITLLLSDIRLLIEPKQRAVIDNLSPALRLCAGFHIGWWEPDGRDSSVRHGKAVRPALSITCARAAGGAMDAAIAAAVVVELVHDCSLLHDDIMDGDVTRRHRPAAWVVYGVPMAILTGDALLVLALDLVHEGASGSALRKAALELCAGQSADLAFEQRTKVWLPEWSSNGTTEYGRSVRRGVSIGCARGRRRQSCCRPVRAVRSPLGTLFSAGRRHSRNLGQ
ncbi:polyprenyl synthetase family protein [Mycobacterium shottsii]|uniref:polyprenyl synthetase family protein n=1 Tax=Mycobacterium shottsii TaxID=133549 RepID=UPI0018E9C3D1